MRKIALNIVLVLIIALISMPLLQMRFRLIGEKPLHGAFVPAGNPDFSRSNWYSGAFQDQVEKYLKDHIGFRNFLVRLQNQLDFKLFRKANAEGAIVGIDRQLFEYDYIRSWLGTDYPGDAFARQKMNRTRYVQDYLKREKGIDLVVVFEPGKASFYPEYIPSRLAKQKAGPSTYDRYLALAREAGVDFMDFHAYFMQLKTSSKYPLFPRYGTHWSVFGSRFAADSLIRFIENRRGIELPVYHADSVVISAEPWDTDDDVLKTMNLLCGLKGEELAYPVFTFDSAAQGDRPWVLTVADSYYWNIFNTRIPKHLFANEAFWFFNSLVYPDFYYGPKYMSELNLKEEVEKQDVIFLMVTERFLHKFDWRFIDRLYALYTPEWLRDPVYDNINGIMDVDGWYGQMIEKAERQGISLEQALENEAKYMLYQGNRNEYMIRYGHEHYMRIIRESEGWYRHIMEKAEKENVPVNEMLLRDALYVFQQEQPALYEMNRGVAETTEEIRSDSLQMALVGKEAIRYRFDPRTLPGIRARQLYREKEILRTMEAIRNDPAWLADVQRKAKEKSITLEAMMRLDAEYVYEHKFD